MKVLVACEESQEVTKAFRRYGHQAFSSDLKDCTGGHPEWHIKGDATKLLNEDFDLLIAHPPCPFLTNAAAHLLFKNGELNIERYEKGLKAKELFEKFLNCNIPLKCIENPVPSKVFGLPQYTQIIHPYFFGSPLKKRTALWLRELPPLIPTNIIRNATPALKSTWFNSGGKDRSTIRSKTNPAIADAMARQWGELKLKITADSITTYTELERLMLFDTRLL